MEQPKETLPPPPQPPKEAAPPAKEAPSASPPQPEDEMTAEYMEDVVNSVEDDVYKAFLQFSANKKLARLEPVFEKFIRFLKRTEKNINIMTMTQRKLENESSNNTLIVEKTSKSLEKEQLSLQEMQSLIDADHHAYLDSQQRAMDLRDRIKILKKENSELVAAIKEGVQLSPEQQDQLQELMDYKAKLTFDLDDEMKRIVTLRTSVADIYEKYRVVESEKLQLEKEITDLKERDTFKRQEIERESRTRDAYDKELKLIRSAVSVKQQESKGKQDTISKLTEENALLDIHISNQIQLITQFSKEKESTLVKILRMAEESKEQSSSTNRLEQENGMMEREVKDKLVLYSAQRAELKRNLKHKEEIQRRLNILESLKYESEETKQSLRDGNEQVSKELEEIRKSCEVQKKLLDDLTRERNWLHSLINKSVGNTARTSDALLIYDQLKSNYEFDLLHQRRSIKELEEKIEIVADSRAVILRDSVELQKRYVKSIKDLKMKEEQIFDYRKKMTEVERKLKHQQALYEAVQNDRNIYSKHLLDSQNDMMQMKRRLKTMYYQINNYKEEIKSKTANLQRALSDNQKLVTDIKDIEEEIKKLRHQNELSQAYIRKQAGEEVSLIHFVKSADLERTKQEHSFKILIGERDNLSTQMIKQTADLTRVYDHLRVLHSALRHSDSAYVKTRQDLNTTKARVYSLRHESLEYKAETYDLKSVRHLKSQLEYEKMIEEMKYNTMKRESLLALNIHRWRRLESNNPKLYELIQIFQGLQRRLILKKEQEVTQEKQIEENEKLYLQLRSIQAHQLGPEARGQIRQFKTILSDKRDMLNTLSIQLQMYKAQLRENEYLTAKLDLSIQELKKRYIRTRLKKYEKPVEASVAPAGLLTLPRDTSLAVVAESKEEEEETMMDELPLLPSKVESS